MPVVSNAEYEIGMKVGELILYGDPVNHPKHYTSHPSGVECITVTEHFNFNVGNAIKYLWRAGLKNDALEDLEKALWYVQRELKRLGGNQNEHAAKVSSAGAPSASAQDESGVSR